MRLRSGLFFLVALFVGLCFLLQAIGIHHRTIHTNTHHNAKEPHTASIIKDTRRELKADYNIVSGGRSLSSGDRPNSLPYKDADFVDVPKIKSKGSLALSHAVFSKNMAMAMDPTLYLKQSLQDKDLMKKMRDMEDHRQDLYLKLLKNRGQLVTNLDGSKTIISFPAMPVRVPNTLKYRPVEDWTKTEKIWKNV